MEINLVAVLLCGVAAMVVGFIWHGPLFGKMWMRDVIGEDCMTGEGKEEMKHKMWIYYLTQFILSLITAFVLAVHIEQWSDPTTPAVGITFCTWLGFIATTTASNALWGGKCASTAWKMFLITAGGQLVTFIVFGIILSIWM